jgi:hypothetical protein
MNNRRYAILAQRVAARRKREDESPRLGDEVPGLLSLRLEIAERAGLLVIKHVRHVVVDRAPALFVLCCSDTRCHDGVYDLTATVMGALHARETIFHGDDDCNGSIGRQQGCTCGRVLHFDAVASYA